MGTLGQASYEARNHLKQHQESGHGQPNKPIFQMTRLSEQGTIHVLSHTMVEEKCYDMYIICLIFDIPGVITDDMIGNIIKLIHL